RRVGCVYLQPVSSHSARALAVCGGSRGGAGVLLQREFGAVAAGLLCGAVDGKIPSLAASSGTLSCRRGVFSDRWTGHHLELESQSADCADGLRYAVGWVCHVREPPGEDRRSWALRISVDVLRS